MWKQRNKKRGFTLIEMLVVIIIIATLATGVVLTVSKEPGKARVAVAKKDIAVLETALERFRLDMSRYPDEEEGLMALAVKPETEDADKWQGPYIKRVENDPWGMPYIYANPGFFNTEGYDLTSYGADRTEGGDPGTENEDIGNWVEEGMEGGAAPQGG